MLVKLTIAEGDITRLPPRSRVGSVAPRSVGIRTRIPAPVTSICHGGNATCEHRSGHDMHVGRLAVPSLTRQTCSCHRGSTHHCIFCTRNCAAA